MYVSNMYVLFSITDEKRNRPYSFGLGKRSNDGQSYSRPYGFGLGRR